MKTDIILNLKLLMAMVFFPMAAVAVTVTPFPPSEFADTEVSTNIAFVVERPAMTRIEFTVALDATPTNNIEVAIGTDANGDGNLSVVESAYAFGYDCGRWFKREVELFDCSDCSNVRLNAEGRIEKTFVLKKRQLDTAWNLVKVTRRGCGAACELVKVEGKLPGFKLEVR